MQIIYRIINFLRTLPKSPVNSNSLPLYWKIYRVAYNLPIGTVLFVSFQFLN